MSDIEVSLSLPLDSDGFLRRACPACSREFKWLPDTSDSAPSPPSEYFCPYCGVGAAPDEWYTEEQRGFIQEEVLERALGPSLQDLSDALGQLGRSSGGLFSISGQMETPERRYARPVFEPDDMRRIDFVCHPSEPVKVDDAWVGPAHCLLCGEPSDATAH